MKKLILLLSFLLSYSFSSIGQIKYAKKVETGFLDYLSNIITVDAGPDWKGYNLDNEQNGVDLNMINSIRFKNDISLGIGLGYLNFQGIHGYSVFLDYEYYNSTKKITPITNFKVGYNRIFNQYEGGTVGVPVELGFGAIFKVNDKIRISALSGFLFTQQSMLIPLRMGVRF